MGRASVLVADGQRLFAECLSMALADEPGLVVVPEQPTRGSEVLAAVERHSPDVVLLDYWIPGAKADGPALTSDIRAADESSRVLLLSWIHGAQHAQAALAAGAAGFLPKSLSLSQLVEAVRRAHAGTPLVFGDQLADLIDSIEQRSEEAEDRWRRLLTLTPREIEILDALGQGRPGAEVAEALGMKPTSLKTRVHKILRKLGVRTQLEAIAMARRERLLPTPTPEGTSVPGSRHHFWTP